MDCQTASNNNNNNERKKMNNNTIGKSVSRSVSLKLLNEMLDDPSGELLDALRHIPACQKNRRLRKFISLAAKRGVSASVLSDFVATVK